MFNLFWKPNRQRLTPKTYEEVCCSLWAPGSSEEKGKYLASDHYLAFGSGDQTYNNQDTGNYRGTVLSLRHITHNV